MSQTPSLAGRAALAIALMIGFYLLAVGIAAGLLWIPYAEYIYMHRLHLKLALGCLIGAGVILWSVLPRPDRFEAPGPELARDKHPRLFALIDETAAATGQPAPDEVYLVHDVNAWVSSRGGVMGFGSRRIMGLGLPLMQTIDVSEFRAVMAHEFGHYHGGDVAVGPWVYTTRQAIGRTLHGLGDGWLRKPFAWYGTLFLRVTHAISRAQEFAADALAARVAGVAPLASGLRRIAGAGVAFQPYWENEVDGVISAGYRPPIVQGFQRYLSAEPIARSVGEWVEKEEREGTSDPLDTHPPLRERIAAVAALPERVRAHEPDRAITLLADPEAEERRMLDHMLVAEYAAKIKDITWEDVGTQVLVPAYARALANHRDALVGLTVGGIAEPLRHPASVAQAPAPTGQPTDDPEARGRWLVGAAVASALAGQGYPICSLPGEPVIVQAPDGEIDPFAIARDLSTGALDPAAWRGRCESLGIAGLPLVSGDARPDS